MSSITVITEVQPAHRDPLLISYLTLRKSVGVLGIALPVVLVGGSMIFEHTHQLLNSLSAYYYTSMRNLFVGILCGVALFLYCYRGYERKDTIVSNLAGLFALAIAFLPTAAPGVNGGIISTLHYVFSGLFFIVLSYISIFLFTKLRGILLHRK